MGATHGYYSLIQYCPDPSRGECANVGVALFCPETAFLDAAISTNNDRVRRFFGRDAGDTMDLRELDNAKNAMLTRLQHEREAFKSVEDFSAFVQTRANEIRLTPPRPVKVSCPPDQLLGLLFDRLVGGKRESKKPGADWTSLKRLDDLLRQTRFAGRIQFDHQVVVPILGRKILVPYAFRNGRMNLIKPETFPSLLRTATEKAMRLAIEGDLLCRHADGGVERKLIVLARAESQANDTLSVIRAIMKEYHTDFVHLDDVDAFARRIDREAEQA